MPTLEQTSTSADRPDDQEEITTAVIDESDDKSEYFTAVRWVIGNPHGKPDEFFTFSDDMDQDEKYEQFFNYTFYRLLREYREQYSDNYFKTELDKFQRDDGDFLGYLLTAKNTRHDAGTSQILGYNTFDEFGELIDQPSGSQQLFDHIFRGYFTKEYWGRYDVRTIMENILDSDWLFNNAPRLMSLFLTNWTFITYFLDNVQPYQLEDGPFHFDQAIKKLITKCFSLVKLNEYNHVYVGEKLLGSYFAGQATTLFSDVSIHSSQTIKSTSPLVQMICAASHGDAWANELLGNLLEYDFSSSDEKPTDFPWSIFNQKTYFFRYITDDACHDFDKLDLAEFLLKAKAMDPTFAVPPILVTFWREVCLTEPVPKVTCSLIRVISLMVSSMVNNSGMDNDTDAELRKVMQRVIFYSKAYQDITLLTRALTEFFCCFRELPAKLISLSRVLPLSLENLMRTIKPYRKLQDSEKKDVVEVFMLMIALQYPRYHEAVMSPNPKLREKIIDCLEHNQDSESEYFGLWPNYRTLCIEMGWVNLSQQSSIKRPREEAAAEAPALQTHPDQPTDSKKLKTVDNNSHFS